LKKETIMDLLEYMLNAANSASRKLPIRNGKTRKDHRSGSHSRRLDNRQKRGDYDRELASCKKTRSIMSESFPTMACNGKKNRHRYTGKGNQTVIIG
jgi:hypothetical protein